MYSVFCEYEANNYSKDARQSLYKTINSKEYINMLSAYGAYEEDKLVGIIATRDKGRQIALFFVKGDYQRKGVGKTF